MESKYDEFITPLKKGEVNLGTSIMAVAYDGGVVVGADSRTSTGTYVANRVTNKLTKIHDSIYICRSGSAADTQAVADIVKAQIASHAVSSGRAPRVDSAAHMFKRICYENKDRLMAGIIVAGYDAVNGGSVYSIPLGGALIPQPFAIGGSGSTYIYGYCDSEFKPGMNKEETRAFVKKALAHAMSRDGSSGGVIRTVVIDENGVDRDFTSGDALPYM